jgi:hypothetical protein
MTDDYIDNAFADLDVFYPGSKRKRRESALPKTVDHVQIQQWDAKPQVKTLPNGRDVELFTVGALAQALGRPFVSIRVWNEKGYLPKAPYRLPTKKNIHGEDHKGRRLYSRAMIETAVQLFIKAGLLEVKRIDWAVHRHLSIEIAEAWSQILANETKNESSQTN